MRYLLDTNICVHLLRGHYNVDKSIDSVGWENCCISEITELELKVCVELSRSRDGRDRSKELKRFLDSIALFQLVHLLTLLREKRFVCVYKALRLMMILIC